MEKAYIIHIHTLPEGSGKYISELSDSEFKLVANEVLSLGEFTQAFNSQELDNTYLRII